jgi:heme/copper-type cytochrome/quinol oxidase subunit 2
MDPTIDDVEAWHGHAHGWLSSQLIDVPGEATAELLWGIMMWIMWIMELINIAIFLASWWLVWSNVGTQTNPLKTLKPPKKRSAYSRVHRP